MAPHNILGMLRRAPASQLNPLAVEDIKKWADPPKAEEVWTVIYKCTHFNAATRNVMEALGILFTEACAREGTTPVAFVARKQGKTVEQFLAGHPKPTIH